MHISRLSLKINLILILLLIVSLSLSGIVSYIHFEKKLINQSKIEAESLIQFAADEVISPLYFLNIEKMDDIIANIKKNPNVLSVYLLHPDGRGITDGNREDNAIFNKEFTDEFIQQTLKKNTIFSQRDSIELKIASPVVLNEKIGYIVIYYSLEELNDTLTMLVVEFIAVIIFIFVIVFIIGTYIFKKLTNPILKLKRSAEKMTKGDYDTKISVFSNDEIGDLANSFDSMRKEIKSRSERINALLEQKDEFINQLGHDLKNPLNPLLHLLPILEKQENNPKRKEMLQVVNRNVKYMKNLVVKTIELAKLNSPDTQFHFNHLNLLETVKNMVDINQLLFQQKQIDVINKIPDDIIIHADKLRLEELFNNLLNNAVKYSEKKSTIILDAKNQHDTVTVSIKDSGIGMTNQQMKKIFDEFYKADSSRHDFDSSGLGMSICKRIVEKHGGHIWAESEGLGKGSIFYITFPLQSKKDETTSDIEEPDDFSYD